MHLTNILEAAEYSSREGAGGGGDNHPQRLSDALQDDGPTPKAGGGEGGRPYPTLGIAIPTTATMGSMVDPRTLSPDQRQQESEQGSGSKRSGSPLAMIGRSLNIFNSAEAGEKSVLMEVGIAYHQAVLCIVYIKFKQFKTIQPTRTRVRLHRIPAYYTIQLSYVYHSLTPSSQHFSPSLFAGHSS